MTVVFHSLHHGGDAACVVHRRDGTKPTPYQGKHDCFMFGPLLTPLIKQSS
jgi:hypothetical protein